MVCWYQLDSYDAEYTYVLDIRGIHSFGSDGRAEQWRGHVRLRGDLVAEGEVTDLLLTNGVIHGIVDISGAVLQYFLDVVMVNILDVLPFPLRGSQKQ